MEELILSEILSSDNNIIPIKTTTTTTTTNQQINSNLPTRIPSPVRTFRKLPSDIKSVITPTTTTSTAITSKRNSISNSIITNNNNNSNSSTIKKTVITGNNIISGSKSSTLMTGESRRKSAAVNGKIVAVGEELKKSINKSTTTSRPSLNPSSPSSSTIKSSINAPISIIKKLPISNLRSSNSIHISLNSPTVVSTTPSTSTSVITKKRLSTTIVGEGREKVTSLSSTSTSNNSSSSSRKVSGEGSGKIVSTPKKSNALSSTPVASTSRLTSSTTRTTTPKLTVSKTGINSTSTPSTTRKPILTLTTTKSTVVRNTPSKNPTVPVLGRKKSITTLSSSPSSSNRINANASVKSSTLSSRKSINSTMISTPIACKTSAIVLGKKSTITSVGKGKGKEIVKVGSLIIKKKVPVVLVVDDVEVVNMVESEVVPIADEIIEEREKEVKGLGISTVPRSTVKIDEEEKVEKVPEEEEKEEEIEILADQTITLDNRIVDVEEISNSSRRDSWETLPPSARPSIASPITFIPVYPIPESPLSSPSRLIQSVVSSSASCKVISVESEVEQNRIEVEKSVIREVEEEEEGEEEIGNQSWETESNLNCSQSSTLPNILSRSPELTILPSRRTSLPLLISTKIPRPQSDSPIHYQFSSSSSSPNPILISPQSQLHFQGTTIKRPISTISEGTTKNSHHRSLSYSPLLSSNASTISFNSTSTTSTTSTSSSSSSGSSSSNSIPTARRSPGDNSNDQNPGTATISRNQIRIQPNTIIDSLPPPPPADHYKPLPLLERSRPSKSFNRSISSPSLSFDTERKPSTPPLRKYRDSMTLEELLRQGSSSSSSSSPTTNRGGGERVKVDWLLSGREGDDDGFEKAMRRNYEDLLEEETELLIGVSEKILVPSVVSNSSSSPTSTTIRSQQLQSQSQQNRKKSTSIESIEIWKSRCETLENSLKLERQQFASERQTWELYKRQSISQDLSPSNSNNNMNSNNNEVDEKKVHSIELSWKRAAGSMEISRRNYLALADAARTEREIVGSQLESLSILTNLMNNLKKK